MKSRWIRILCIGAAFLLAGCCREHVWSEVDCEEKAYCVQCGKEAEQALGHSWVEADCRNPRHCERCGLKDGFPLGHQAEGTVCLRCGEQMYDELSDFETYNIVTDLKAEAAYAFTTGTKNEPEQLTTGEIRLLDYGPIAPDDGHPAREGYEWQYVRLTVRFFDDAARSAGVTVMAVCEDYHNIVLRGSTQRQNAEGLTVYTVCHEGQEKELCYRRTGHWSGWHRKEEGGRENVYTSLWEIQRPLGYDGVVVGLYNSTADWPEGSYLFEIYKQPDFFFFRLP